MPNFLLNGKYSLNKNQIYIPGGYAETNGILYLKCHTGFLANFDSPIEFACTKRGEWSPPLRTCEGNDILSKEQIIKQHFEILDKPGHCNYGHVYVKEGESVTTPFPICGEIRCREAKTENLTFEM